MSENVHQWRSYRVSQTGGNGGGMDNLTRRVEHLEQDSHQIKIDLGILTARSESFATKADVESVRTEVQGVRAEVQGVRAEGQSIRAEVQSVRAEVQNVRAELIQELAALEVRTNNRFDALNAKITWTLLVPAILAVLAWFVKEAVLKG
ncbi:hypothetical protein WB66_17565 [bacteria symbiont BFo1 of Frankliniella occidentalis]|nr:hypothetical protein WB66_17565 [bacteria symbiont BFo1 of Frankliniella occidentalis]KYP88799.1 hypothetical protein WB91_16395 [bacteria symbiont BFo1 of Frankliniella occidentalis]